MKLKWLIIIAVVVLAIAAAVYISTSSPSDTTSAATSVPAATSTQSVDNTPWIIGGVVLGIVGFAFWQRRNISNALRGMSGQPSIMDWSCSVKSAQKMGEYSLLISDSLNKSYVLDLGAVLAGMQIPKDSWRRVFDEIGEGSELKFRVLTASFAESSSSAIPILRLNSYTPKYGSSF